MANTTFHCKTKAAMKEFQDSSSCPIAPDDATKQKIKLRHHVGIFTGRKREYGKWRARLLAHLERSNLRATLERTPPEEPFSPLNVNCATLSAAHRTTQAVLYQNRCEKDCDTIEEICTTIEGEPLDKVAGCTFAKEVLDTLDQEYLIKRKGTAKKAVKK